MSAVVERARAAVRELLACYADARTIDEREDIARLIGCLQPGGGRSLAELAERALVLARESEDDRRKRGGR